VGLSSYNYCNYSVPTCGENEVLTGTQPNYLREEFPHTSADLTLYIIKLKGKTITE